MIWEGDGFCPDGVMTGEYVRGYYKALLVNRVKVTDGHATFFKKLRPGQKRGGDAENWLGRKSERYVYLKRSAKISLTSMKVAQPSFVAH